LNPDDAEAWNNLGNCFSRLAEGKAAIEAYTRAVALRPDYAEAFYNKANAHFIEEEDEKAIAYAELAIELNPKLAERIGQWINISRNRLISKRDQEEHERRVRERVKKTID
jgi:tetratricopeptide (TPR) repeat protein